MKVIVAGSRCFRDNDDTYYDKILDMIIEFESKYGIVTEIVSGCARGPDTIGEIIADQCGIPIKRFPAQWDRYGRSAGMIRNSQMADYADGAIILWDNISNGTSNMIKNIKSRHKPFILDILE